MTVVVVVFFRFHFQINVAQDVARGYYTEDQAREQFGVVLEAAGKVDVGATFDLRREGR